MLNRKLQPKRQRKCRRKMSSKRFCEQQEKNAQQDDDLVGSTAIRYVDTYSNREQSENLTLRLLSNRSGTW